MFYQVDKQMSLFKMFYTVPPLSMFNIGFQSNSNFQCVRVWSLLALGWKDFDGVHSNFIWGTVCVTLQ